MANGMVFIREMVSPLAAFCIPPSPLRGIFYSRCRFPCPFSIPFRRFGIRTFRDNSRCCTRFCNRSLRRNHRRSLIRRRENCAGCTDDNGFIPERGIGTAHRRGVTDFRDAYLFSLLFQSTSSRNFFPSSVKSMK